MEGSEKGRAGCLGVWFMLTVDECRKYSSAIMQPIIIVSGCKIRPSGVVSLRYDKRHDGQVGINHKCIIESLCTTEARSEFFQKD